MKYMKFGWLLAFFAVGVMVTDIAFAHGRHRHGGPRVSFGFVFGPPAYWHYPPPYYYYPPVYHYRVAPVEPVTYVERGDIYVPRDHQPGYWYYCPEAKVYYPYVQQCAGGWQRVNPTPPAQ